MNLTRAFSAMALLAVVVVIFAVLALGSALRQADADVVGNAHRALALAAHRIGNAYSGQIASLRRDLTVPLGRETLQGYGRRVVGATIGDNEGVDGGFFLTGLGIVGDGPQPVVGVQQRRAIADLAARVNATGTAQLADVAFPNGDEVALDAVPLADGDGIAWARERIAASSLLGRRSTVPLIASAIASCVALVAVAAWIVWSIRRDAHRVIEAIAAYEANPAARPPLPHGDFGTIARAVGLMAARRAAAESLAQRSERLAAIGRLAANAAHEIRNPLNALRLQTEVLGMRVGPALAAPAAKLRGEIERLDAVVSGMLAVGSDAPVAAVPVDLREIAERAVDVLHADARSRARDISFACTTAQTVVHGDAGKLMQLAINVIANALDAAPPGSTVDVHLAAGPLLCIRDRGAGIAGDDAMRVFEPFFTTKASGTGLGLAIAHEIARAHGARIEVRSVPGDTTFEIDFRGAVDART